MDYFIGLSILYNISLISVVRVITGFVRTLEQCYAVSVILHVVELILFKYKVVRSVILYLALGFKKWIEKYFYFIIQHAN